jgi:hypothetical protein
MTRNARRIDLNPTTSPADLESLVKGRAVGYSLEAPFYTSREVYGLDLAAVFAKHWLFCATEAEIPEPGDFTTVDIGPYSVIILRDDDEHVRAATGAHAFSALRAALSETSSAPITSGPIAPTGA